MTTLIALMLSTAAPAASRCHATPAPADRVRKVVVGHPFEGPAKASRRWSVLALSPDGRLDDTGVRFEMGTPRGTEIAFTPDGSVGLVAQEDGSIGVFRFEGDEVVVVHEAFGGESFHASRVSMDPSGDFAWVVDSDWEKSGGGLYRVDIACDGRLSLSEHRVPGRQPSAVLLDPNDATRAFIPSRGMLGAPEGHQAMFVDLSSPSLSASSQAFEDDEAIVSSAVWTDDGRYALLADNASYSGADNRIAVLEVGEDGLVRREGIPAFKDPTALVCSPFDGTVLVASRFTDSLWVLERGGDAERPYRVRGEVAYRGTRPKLPTSAVRITRGSLAGTVLVAENTGVRVLRFEQGGGVSDRGCMSMGDGYDAIVSAIGVQP